MNEGWLQDLLGYRFIRTEGAGGQTFPERATLIVRGSAVVTDDPALGATILQVQGAGGASGASEGTVRVFRARVATTAPVPLSGLAAVDGEELVENDVVLVWRQGNPLENGLYRARDVAWVRADFADSGSELIGASLVAVSEGAAYGNKVFMMVSDEPISVGSSALDFQLVGSGDALSLRGIALDDATVGAPLAGDVLAFDSGALEYVATKLRNANVAEDAAIAVDKLAPGGAGQVLRTAGGKPVWGVVTSADLGEVTATASPVAGTLDNYAPSGWATATVVRLQATAPVTIRGLGPASARRKILVNVSAHAITLANDAGGQATGNRVLTPRALTLLPGQSVVVVYDAPALAWRAIDAMAPPEVASIPHDFPGNVLMRGDLRVYGRLDVAPDVPLGFLIGEIRTGVVSAYSVRSNSFLYPDAVLTTVLLPLTRGQPEGYDGRWVLSDYQEDETSWRCTTPGARLRFQFSLPPTSRIQSVRLGVRQGSADFGDNRISAFVRQQVIGTEIALGASYSEAGLGAYSSLNPVLAGGQVTGYHRLEAHLLSYPAFANNHLAEIVVKGSDAAGASYDALYWVELGFLNPGPYTVL